MIKKESLWDEDIELNPMELIRKVLDKAENPQEVDYKKVLKSKKLTDKEKIVIIEDEVKRKLGKHVEDTIIIRDRQGLHDYIDKAIENGILGLDTETNNSLDFLTCKLMGLCLYTYGLKQAYIPVSHVDIDTGELLPRQVTTQDIHEELSRLGNTKIVYHNAKFDYQVIKCTCGVELSIYWDTQIGAYLLDENGSHKLKDLYIQLIDPSQEKYDIESLFGNVPYEIVPIELFALYSATDPYITIKLYEWQVKKYDLPDNAKVRELLMRVEMPLVKVTAEMELRGITLDKEYAKRLSAKYRPMLESIKTTLEDELNELKPKIDEWKRTDGQSRVGKKTKSEQLTDPINVSSPTQLAILFYDVLKVDLGNDERATGEDALKEIKAKYNLTICDTILKYREFDKLINTYIDKLPNELGPDGRVHGSFNQLGTTTGRYSSSDPNLQNIPSHTLCVRLLFKASQWDKRVEINDDYFIVDRWDSVETIDGWKVANDLKPNDILIGEDNNEIISNIIEEKNNLKLFTKVVEGGGKFE